MKNILWISAHAPLAIQIKELERLFGKIQIDQRQQDPEKDRGYMSAAQIVAEFKNGHYDEMVIVAPLSVIEKIIELGVKPLKARVEPLPTKAGSDFEWRGRYFKFLGIERVLRIEVVTQLLRK